jgi:hypothetical protein
MNFEFIKRIPGMPDQFFRSKPVPPEPTKKAGKVVKKQAAAKDLPKKDLKKVPETRKPSKKNEEESESEATENDDDDEEQEEEEEEDGYIPNTTGLKQDSGMNFDWQGMYGDIQKKAEEQQKLKEE